jgi:hypothetical protein
MAQAATAKAAAETETVWTQIATTYQKSITLSNQTRGVELEYCVLASNRTGDGPISNTVLVVL